MFSREFSANFQTSYCLEHTRGSAPESSNNNSFLRHYCVNVWLYIILDELCTDLKMDLHLGVFSIKLLVEKGSRDHYSSNLIDQFNLLQPGTVETSHYMKCNNGQTRVNKSVPRPKHTSAQAQYCYKVYHHLFAMPQKRTGTKKTKKCLKTK